MEIDKDQPNYPFIQRADGGEIDALTEERAHQVIDAIKKVYDPEIPVDIFELGLIYTIEFVESSEEEAKLRIEMTLTAPGCPVAGEMPKWVENAAYSLSWVKECHVELVWEPFWTPQRMSLRAKLELNML